MHDDVAAVEAMAARTRVGAIATEEQTKANEERKPKKNNQEWRRRYLNEVIVADRQPVMSQRICYSNSRSRQQPIAIVMEA